MITSNLEFPPTGTILLSAAKQRLSMRAIYRSIAVHAGPHGHARIARFNPLDCVPVILHQQKLALGCWRWRLEVCCLLPVLDVRGCEGVGGWGVEGGAGHLFGGWGGRMESLWEGIFGGLCCLVWGIEVLGLVV